MARMKNKSDRGFTLIELMVSLALGILVVGAAVQLFSQGVDATWVVSQKAEMQQDLRAATDMMEKDISLAGEGLPLGAGVALPTGTANAPILGYSTTCLAYNNCLAGVGIAYPSASNVAVLPTLYGIMPAWQRGISPGTPQPTDVVSVAYVDTVFALQCYSFSFPGAPNKNPVTFTLINPLPPNCAPPNPAPQAANDPVVGLQPGDLVFFQGTRPGNGNSAYAVGDVTGVAAGACPCNITFTDGDPLWINQSAAATGDLAALVGGTNAFAQRIFVISYYLWTLPDPLGVGPGTPVLMRQVNGHQPIPLAENVVNLQLTYDTYDQNGNLLNDSGDGGHAANNTSYNLIRKVNLKHLSIRSQLSGTRSALMATRGYQTFDMQTSISARNLSYQNRYGN